MTGLMEQLLPEKSHCTYTACFCEENVWKLCEYIENAQHTPGWDQRDSDNELSQGQDNCGSRLDVKQSISLQKDIGSECEAPCECPQAVQKQISQLKLKDSHKSKSFSNFNSQISSQNTNKQVFNTLMDTTTPDSSENNLDKSSGHTSPNGANTISTISGHNTHLNCAHNSRPDVTRAYAVFISNENKQIPIWKQRARRSPGAAVVWDYHVILLYRLGHATLVYDLDTTLTFPCSLNIYLAHALKSDQLLKPAFHRKFRVIPAQIYLRTFASNRQHMINKENNQYMATPPDYPPIKTQDSENNIEDFISMAEGKGHGMLMDMAHFIQFFS